MTDFECVNILQMALEDKNIHYPINYIPAITKAIEIIQHDTDRYAEGFDKGYTDGWNEAVDNVKKWGIN